MTDLEFEDECCRRCPHCNRARDMMKLGESGHTLRYRDDTREWIHEWRKKLGDSSMPIAAMQLTQTMCQANQLRKDRNG